MYVYTGADERVWVQPLLDAIGKFKYQVKI